MAHLGRESSEREKLGKLLIPGIARKSVDTLRGFICDLFGVEDSVRVGKHIRITREMLEPKLLGEVFETPGSSGISARIYHYAKGTRTMYGTYIYGIADSVLFIPRFGLVGSKRRSSPAF